MQERKLTTATDRVRARLTGQSRVAGGSMRQKGSTGYQEVEVALDLAYSQVAGLEAKVCGSKTKRYTKRFRVPSHKNPDANAVRVQLTSQTIAAAKKENAALGEIRASLHDYRIVR